jgi:hypothetical protein
MKNRDEICPSASNFGSRRVTLRLVELTARPNLGPLALISAPRAAPIRESNRGRPWGRALNARPGQRVRRIGLIDPGRRDGVSRASPAR